MCGHNIVSLLEEDVTWYDDIKSHLMLQIRIQLEAAAAAPATPPLSLYISVTPMHLPVSSCQRKGSTRHLCVWNALLETACTKNK